ncbi:MAG: hypothetical protein V2A79_17620, partial [Planctomycetota bacterium]
MSGLKQNAVWFLVWAVLGSPMGTSAQSPVNPPQLSGPLPTQAADLDYDQTLIRRLEGNPNTLNPLLQGSGQEYAVL